MNTTVLETATHKIIVGGNPNDPLVRKAPIERVWRDSELLRTDKLILLPDYPKKELLLIYRQNLRDYPGKAKFPKGVRPSLPI